jgi:hypothetical protein
MTTSPSDVAVAPWPYQDSLRGLLFAACFQTRPIADGTLVASYFPITAKAVMAALAAQGWIVLDQKGPGTMSIGPASAPTKLAVTVDACSAIRQALLVSNVYVDADLAMKLGGNPAAPKSPAFIAASPTSIIPPCLNPDDDADVCPNPSEAVHDLNPNVPSMRYVLLARQGENL